MLCLLASQWLCFFFLDTQKWLDFESHYIHIVLCVGWGTAALLSLHFLYFVPSIEFIRNVNCPLKYFHEFNIFIFFMFSKHVSSSGDPPSNSETTNSPYLFTKFVVCKVFLLYSIEWQFTFQESLANFTEFCKVVLWQDKKWNHFCWKHLWIFRIWLCWNPWANPNNQIKKQACSY